MSADGPSAAPGPATYVGRLPSIVWRELPTLLVSSASVCVVAAVVMVVAPGVTPFALLGWAVVVAPVFSALVVQAHDMVRGRTPGTFSIVTYLRRTGGLGIAAWLPVAATGACSLVAVQVWRETHSPFALASAAVGAVATTLLTLGAVVAVPVGVDHPRLRRGRLLVTCLYIVALRPVPVFAVVGFLVAAVSAAVHIAASIVFLIPGPLALVLVVAVWTTADASGLRPQPSED